MDDEPPTIWVAACAHQLQRRWRTVDPGDLEQVARSLWADAALRSLRPDQAALAWLAPLREGREA